MKYPRTLINKYNYVANNPTTFIDPSGKIAGVLLVIAISGLVAGTLNALLNNSEESFGQKFWKGFIGGVVASSAVIALAYLGAFIGGTILAGGAVGAFIGGTIGGTAGGVAGSQLKAKITHGRNATKGELVMGGLLGGIGGATIGATYGSGYNTYPLEPGSQTTNNLPANDINFGDPDWHMFPSGQPDPFDNWPKARTIHEWE